MRKKLILITFLLLIIFGIVACGKNKISKNENINSTNQEQQKENKDIDEKQQENSSKYGDIEEKSQSQIEYINIAPEEVKIPILMYHSISDEDPNNNLLVPTAMFEEQMAWLEEHNFTTMNMDEVLESMETGKVPKRPVAITFDDGYANNYTSAFPSLKKHKLKATFFIITDGVDNGYYMSSDNLKEMREAGMSIENHTANHLELNNLSKSDAYESIKKAQDYLRNVIGSDGNYLCYPVGKYNDETIQIEKELGIKAAVTTKGGIASSNDGFYTLKRVRISPMSIEGFASIFSQYIN